MASKDVALRVEQPRGRGRGPADDWNAIRSFVRKAAGKWCRVLAHKGGETERARLYQRAKYNLRDGFEVTSRIEKGEARVYARAKTEAC